MHVFSFLLRVTPSLTSTREQGIVKQSCPTILIKIGYVSCESCENMQQCCWIIRKAISYGMKSEFIFHKENRAVHPSPLSPSREKWQLLIFKKSYKGEDGFWPEPGDCSCSHLPLFDMLKVIWLHKINMRGNIPCYEIFEQQHQGAHLLVQIVTIFHIYQVFSVIKDPY